MAVSHDCPFTPGDSVAAYLRDSGGDDQDQSVAQQETEVRSYCAAHKLTLSIIFKDEAKTASTTVGRDDFWKMIHHFHNGAGEKGVIIWRTNRFGRNINDSQFYKADLRRRGFLVHSLKDNIPEGSAGQLIEFALDWKDQVFIEQLSEDVKRGLRQLVQVYGCVPGTPPRGFMRQRVVIGKRRDGSDHIGHRWVPDPEKTDLVKRAFAMRAKGATTPQIIKATGLYKSVNCYSTFFSNRLFIGELVFGDITIPDYCEPLIDLDTWEEVQRVARRRSLPQSNIDHPRRVSSPFMLSGLIFCSECGSPMSAQSFREHDYYACSRRKRRKDCHARNIPRRAIETSVIKLLEERLLSIENLLILQREIKNAWSRRSQESEEARHEIKKAITSIQTKIRNITKAISVHGHSKALLNQLDALEIQEADQWAALGKLDNPREPEQYTPPQLNDIAAQLKKELHGDDIRSTLRGLVSRIVAKRTDDQIIGVLYCNLVNGDVPPQGSAPFTRYELIIPVKKRRAHFMTPE